MSKLNIYDRTILESKISNEYDIPIICSNFGHADHIVVDIRDAIEKDLTIGTVSVHRNSTLNFYIGKKLFFLSFPLKEKEEYNWFQRFIIKKFANRCVLITSKEITYAVYVSMLKQLFYSYCSTNIAVRSDPNSTYDSLIWCTINDDEKTYFLDSTRDMNKIKLLRPHSMKIVIKECNNVTELQRLILKLLKI